MKRILFFFCTFFSLLIVQGKEWIDYVNPLMGTGSTYEFSYGNTYPAVAVPWGMNFWSPQTGQNGSGWMYTYDDKAIRGFRQTHQPSPWINDYGTFSIMPITGELKVSSKERAATFSHENEVAKPNYYQVKFDNGTSTELSATSRGAVFNIKFAQNNKQYIVIDAYNGGSGITIDEKNHRITGYAKNNNGGVPTNFANYFVIEYDKPLIGYGTSTNGEITSQKKMAEHNHVCAYLQFDLKDGEMLTLRVASSFISLDQAIVNFNKEVKDKTLINVKEESENSWNTLLGRIGVDGGTTEQLKTFYSCLYRTLLFPREFYEFDTKGNPIYYSPYDGKVHNGFMYTDNGFWDTFRAVHPLFTLVYPEVSQRIMQSLVNTYKESGFLPEWASPGHRNCMIGNNSLSLLTDAWMKGIRGFDSKIALEAMVHQTQAQGHESSIGRNGFDEYNRLGYVPYPDYGEATAKTLEYAYADWCLSRFANSLGNSSIKNEYEKKSQNYKNLFDPQWGFMRAKTKDGKWVEPFDPVEWGGPFTEGSSWHYTWSVLHDVEGLSMLMGGHDKMAARLDSMFTSPSTYKVGTYGFVIHEIAEMVALNMGQYAHGNQPIQHAIFLYNHLGQPWKAQFHSRNVLTKLYNSGIKGYCGDEDNGQTSAWYVFASMGFYPVTPGVPQYVMGSPQFKKITIQLPDNKVFIIDAENNSDKNLYIQSAKLNSKISTHNYLNHDEIVKGGILKLKMADKPNTKRGIHTQDFPYSLSK